MLNEKEVRLHIEENIFQLKLDGYHLFTVQEILPLYKSNEERIGRCNDTKVRMGERKNYNKLSTCITKFSKLKGAGNHEAISYSRLAFRKACSWRVYD